MLGLMQTRPLTTAMLINHAAENHGATEVVSRRNDGGMDRSDWAGVSQKARRITALLARLGLGAGDRVATLAWNRLAHLELYFGVTAAGCVLHTVNPRLSPDQIAFILNDGGAKVICVDPDLLPVLETVASQLTGIEEVLVLCSEAELPGTLALQSLEALLTAQEPVADWPALDENEAAILCHTSGTTGDPKGVLYSHRSIVLHSFACVAPDAMNLSARDSILLVTPLFHVNAWGVPFSAALCGAKLVLPGSKLTGDVLFTLMREERTSFTLGVPTVWFGFLDHVAEMTADQRAELGPARVFMGGAAVPRSLIERFRELLGVPVIQAWGMTETSPVATVCSPLNRHEALDDEALTTLGVTQGRPLCGVELKIEDHEGATLRRGSQTSGRLKIRGPWITSAYWHGRPGDALDEGGWFDTGDIGRLDCDGFLHITDRAKDVIKSGGEWISSIELENAAVAHPDVAEAAVIAVAHPRWQERPLLLIQPRPGRAVSKQAMLDYLTPQIPRWWMPDDVVTVDALPHTASGKVLKAELRVRYHDHLSAAET